jgi:nickel/cobalt exporter
MIAPVLINSFLLGIQHSFEPDHVAAVSVLSAGQNRKTRLRQLMWKSSQWALGHSITLILLSMGALLLKSVLPANISALAEWFIGPMMIWIGLNSLRLAFKGSPPPSAPAVAGAKRHSFISYSLGVGMLHGMAGTGAACTLALTMAANDSITALWIIICQSIAILLTMTAYGYLLSLSFSHFEKQSKSLFKWVMVAVGVFSITIGLWLVLELLVLELTV